MGGVTHDTCRNPANPSIEIETIDYGPFPEAPRLNPKLSPELPLLLATLRIAWEPADAIATIARLEESLLAFSPRFRDHECRGAESYHVFRSGNPGGAKPPGGSAPRGASVDYMPRLALAHLIEHAVIDAQCTITGARRCSGVTALRSNGSERFDIMVECPDERVGQCSLALVLVWICLALEGAPPGTAERRILQTAHLAFERRGERLTVQDVARRLRLAEAGAGAALEALVEVGYLSRDAADGAYRLRDGAAPPTTSTTPSA